MLVYDVVEVVELVVLESGFGIGVSPFAGVDGLSSCSP
jgi:hypothetical protein